MENSSSSNTAPVLTIIPDAPEKIRIPALSSNKVTRNKAARIATKKRQRAARKLQRGKK